MGAWGLNRVHGGGGRLDEAVADFDGAAGGFCCFVQIRRPNLGTRCVEKWERRKRLEWVGWDFGRDELDGSMEEWSFSPGGFATQLWMYSVK